MKLEEIKHKYEKEMKEKEFKYQIELKKLEFEKGKEEKEFEFKKSLIEKIEKLDSYIALKLLGFEENINLHPQILQNPLYNPLSFYQPYYNPQGPINYNQPHLINNNQIQMHPPQPPQLQNPNNDLPKSEKNEL